MPVEDNKQAVQRFYQDVINGRNLDALDELLTPDGVDHTFGSQNPEQAKQFFGMVHQAFPDLHAEVHDVIADGDLVAARVIYTGTHQGEFLGIPATGKQTTTSGSTSSGCRMAGRPSIGAGRTCSAS
jgi:predicted ester cyclase